MLQCLHKPWEWLLLIGQFLMLSKQDKTIIYFKNLTSCFSYLSQKLLFSVLILRLTAKCLLKNCAADCRIYIEFQLLHFFVAKITRLFRGQIDPLIIFGWDILNFVVGLAQWRGLAQTLFMIWVLETTHNFSFNILRSLNVLIPLWKFAIF